ncbi:MAG: hypothetical protein O2867_04470 [Bacteroidetes bacterium]|nr:hypothetical protein [Bacteroidota bacterium]
MKEWWYRYRYPELIATAVFLLFNLLPFRREIDEVHFSFLITSVEYISYYSVVLIMAFRSNQIFKLRDRVIIVFSGLAMEFGPAILFDLLVVRPMSIYASSLYFDSSFMSIVLWKPLCRCRFLHFDDLLVRGMGETDQIGSTIEC